MNSLLIEILIQIKPIKLISIYRDTFLVNIPEIILLGTGLMDCDWPPQLCNHGDKAAATAQLVEEFLLDFDVVHVDEPEELLHYVEAKVHDPLPSL